MIWADVILGARQWLGAAIALALIAAAALAWGYWQTRGGSRWRIVALVLKVAGVLALAACLVEPLVSGVRPRPGSNLMLVVADNSRSLQLGDGPSSGSRGENVRRQLDAAAPWLARLGQDFDVRRYAFDAGVRPVRDFQQELTFEGPASMLAGALDTLGQRFRGQPVAGVIVLTDGNATDVQELASSIGQGRELPPIYPVMLGGPAQQVDVAVTRTTVGQTNFEESPVTITSEIVGRAISGKKVVVRVLDEAGKEIERRILAGLKDDEPSAQRFLVKPEKPGVTFYSVVASLEHEVELVKPNTNATPTAPSDEATLANNSRLVTVDRAGGPYRILYVTGRPNWEFKFLRRALDEDGEVKMSSLVRIAKKEPKLSFRTRSGERANPLFRGFGADGEQAEQYDEPVMLRLGTEDKEELRGGFPKSTDDLYRYHAVIIDDVEAGFFSADQQSLLQKFVSRRGGALLMLGGKDSFADGGYRRTPISEMLPVYLDRLAPPATNDGYRLTLTKEGWLQPWIRLRTNEVDEQRRIAEMPLFLTANRVDSIKPGASVLAQLETPTGQPQPALVYQPFGRGRAAALLVGDLWRWNLRRSDSKASDLERSWRQLSRWLVSEVPAPVEVETRRAAATTLPGVDIVVRARDKQFEPLDNATVTLKVKPPDGREVQLAVDASDQLAGQYVTTFSPRTAGEYRGQVVVTAADGSEVGRRDVGWTVEPDTEEFRSLAPNRELLDRLARETGGELLTPDGLDDFVRSLPNRKLPVVENWTYPLWHQWHVFLVAISCLIGEWGVRRWKGLP
ncbi:MAG TPA: glutamine amidotransferase [Pirellulaceae bacterium]|nr:glutamine amidotransferase [Pirellulaceae bacterium]